jgi:ATP-dependent DNA ligase
MTACDAVDGSSTGTAGSTTTKIQLYAFDILALDGDDLRKLPLHLRKTSFLKSPLQSIARAGRGLLP